jgi:hypothetical protein
LAMLLVVENFMCNGDMLGTHRIRAADAKEVGLGEPSKERYRHPNQIHFNSKALSGVVKAQNRA